MIKFLDLQKINARYKQELKAAVSQVIDSGWFLMGENLKKFEKNLADYIAVKNVIGVANGLDALRLIFKAYIELGYMQEGDEIIVPANTYIATILAITDNRLVPVLVEPVIDNYNLDINQIEKHITNRTKGICVVHLYGQICWSNTLKEISLKYNLKIIEDNAQAIGTEWFGEKSGALGDVSAFSFYPGKNLGALGDSGAVATNDEQLADVVRALGNYGSRQKYINEYQGLNSRMDEIQAALLNVKLKYLDAENYRRREIAGIYCSEINKENIVLPLTGFTIDEILQFNSHVWHLFVIRHPERDRLQKFLADNGIQTLIHYPIPPHKQLAYKYLNEYSYKVTERIHNEVLSLPISPVLEDSEVRRVVEVINQFS